MLWPVEFQTKDEIREHQIITQTGGINGKMQHKRTRKDENKVLHGSGCAKSACLHLAK
jgi:hypothetical protein